MIAIRVAVVSFALLLVGSGVQAQPANPAGPQALTAEQWRADLHYLAGQMPKLHKNLYHTMKPEALAAAVAQLDGEIPHLNDDEITVRLFAIATMPEDSHTGGFGLPPGNAFPLRLRRYGDALYVESAPAAYAAAVGGRLVAIDKTPAEALYARLSTIIPHDTDNPGLLDYIGPVLLTMGHVLHGLDVTPTADAATYVVQKGGKQLTLALTPSASTLTLFGRAPVPGWSDARGTGTPPLWLDHPDKTFWATYLPATKTYYIQFNAVLNAPDETVAHFFEQTFAQASTLPVDKLVLDLRMNTGGNNGLLKPIIVGLIRMPVDRPGHLFVITSRTTYSAAQNLVNRIEQYTDAIFVGQPTGQHVNSYGDPAAITLPNSHIQVGMASVWWQDVSERDRRIETDPEIAADPTFADYSANRDPAMEEIASYRLEQRLEDVVLSATVAHGVSGGLGAYRAYAANPIHEYVRPRMEVRINNLGYTLLGAKRTSDAIAVFTVNAQANPSSANAADSLGEAYADAGQRDNAIASYRQALKLNPNFTSSRTALARLGASDPH